MKKPNFFIVGVPKAGTTTIYNYLNMHSEVFMSPIKEPHYFSKDIRCKFFTQKNCMNACFNLKKYFQSKKLVPKHIAFVEEEEQYLELFRDVLNEKVIGETSTGYLYSKYAAEEIYSFNKDAKILIVLRNPVYRAYSHWKMNLSAGIENISISFIDAIQKDFVSRNKGYCKSHLYVELGQYANQIKRYMDLFPIENIKIVYFEDLAKNMQNFMTDIYTFLELPLIEDVEEVRENVSYMYKYAWLNKIKFLGITKYIPKSVKLRVKGKVSSTVAFPKLTQEDFAYLYLNYYKNEIDLLEKFLNTDLSSWKNIG